MKSIIIHTNQIALFLLVFLSFSCSKSDDAQPTPVLINFSPSNGPKTTIVTINGSNFGTINTTRVFFNDVEAVVQSVTESQIITIVPVRAFTGLVKVISNGTTLMGQEFTYLISDVQVSTLAGSVAGFTDGVGLNAQFNTPRSIAADSQGNLYVADRHNHRIRKITPSGVVSTLAGSSEGFADGTGSNAQFNEPFGITLDNQNNLYVADSNNHKIRKITPSGVVSTLAGNSLGYADGISSNAQFYVPTGLIMDSEDNLYIADTGNHKIRKINPEGVVSTLAGSTGGFTDGTAANSKFYFPYDLAMDSQNNIYVTDAYNYKIRKITPNGIVSTLAGSSLGFANGTGANAQFLVPTNIVIDSENNLFVADYGNHKIRKISTTGVVSTLAGSSEGFADGISVNAKFNNPYGLTIDSENNLYVSDGLNHKIRKITQE